MAHAYFLAGEREGGVGIASAFAHTALGIPEDDKGDMAVLTYELFSIDDARALSSAAHAAPIGAHKAVIVSINRLFHEAQNALLKLVEEPPPNTTFIFLIPSEGLLLRTLRSRLLPLPHKESKELSISKFSRAFLDASDEEREKIIAKLVDRSKSDKDEEKQQARGEAVRLAEDLVKACEALKREGKATAELRACIADLLHFLPVLHTKSAPLKLIFEHLLIVIPKGLRKAPV